MKTVRSYTFLTDDRFKNHDYPMFMGFIFKDGMPIGKIPIPRGNPLYDPVNELSFRNRRIKLLREDSDHKNDLDMVFSFAVYPLELDVECAHVDLTIEINKEEMNQDLQASRIFSYLEIKAKG